MKIFLSWEMHTCNTAKNALLVQASKRKPLFSQISPSEFTCTSNRVASPNVVSKGEQNNKVNETKDVSSFC